ncbi:MAG: YegS/Rv2252/BmrU family lipid kinase [Lachnospiraceae bacterium]|nr:YegS/Rv2252/BmrU family lipid kinase [Lachnospiraceae bacterium]
MTGKMLFIYNPHAGMAKIRSNLLDIIDIFAKAGFEVTVFPTQKQGDAIEAVINRKEGFDMIACSGGDGTLDEVVTGMLRCEEKIPIGYVPAGSTNDFARSIKIPRNMLKAAETIVDGRIEAFDMGKFNNNYFVYVAAFGLFTDVSYETKQDMKNTFGHLAYLIEAAIRLPQVKTYHMKVEYDSGFLEDDFLFGMISNSLSVGGIESITGPDVYLDDGLFEVTLIRNPVQLQDFTDIAADIISGANDNQFIINFKTRHIRFTSEEEIPWTLDGEYGGRPKVADLTNMQKCIEMVVPSGIEIPCLECKKVL